ncbi:MAG: FAD-dependent oxidoreductase [Candidatus Firestonebacteria bacterium]|nr:FAD-dependent oxidoreductase [Candidatus Firestonebacteria bacterium]
METKSYDLIVIGAGPAGLTAALYAGRARLKAAIVDENLPGGWMKTTHLVANYPGVFPEIHGRDLAKRMEDQARHFGADFYTAAEISALELQGAVKRVVLDDEVGLEAKVVILAMGQEPRKLGIPGETKFKGRGLSYCATCDGDFYQDKDVVVIGGGNSAVEESVFLTQFAKSVTLIHQFDKFQCSAIAEEHARGHAKIRMYLCHEPREYIGQDRLEGVAVQDLNTGEKKIIAADGVFVYIGFTPRTEFLKGQVGLDARGYIQADDLMHTNLSGVLAAGDARVKVYRQISTAVSDGTIAALEAEKILREVK